MTSSTISISLSSPSSLSLSLKSRHFSTTISYNQLHFPRIIPPIQLKTSHSCSSSRVRVRVVRASSSSGSSNGVGGGIDKFKPGSVVESDYLPTGVRKRAMDAVDALGRRVTIGDVASKAGLKMGEAQKALQALAADTNGFLEVSDEGDVLYVFAKDYRTKLAGKSLRMKVEPLAEKAKSAAEYLIRVTFGTTLIASIVIVITAIIAIIASSESNDDSRKRRRSRSYNSGFNINILPSDLFWYWNRDYYRRAPTRGNSEGMNFIESVFSYVFGDGDPNQGIEEERWKMIGQYITANGGVIAAEELAPYLDIQTKDERDDSYILPVLLRFDGQPEVDDEGNILYRFPSLQRTASSTGSGRKEYVGTMWSNWDGKVRKFFEEKKWQFSNTSASERAMVIGLGALNLAGVVFLTTLLKNMSVQPGGYISFVAGLLPLLQVYAGSFFAIPLVRWLIVLKTNSEIENRNQARKLRAATLVSPDVSLRRKLLSARDMAQRTFIGKDRIVYSTDKDLDEQAYEEREWERRFQELEKAD